MLCIPLLLAFGCAASTSQHFTVTPLQGQSQDVLESDKKDCDALATTERGMSSDTKGELALDILFAIIDGVGAATGLPFGVANLGVSAGLLAMTAGVAASESKARAEPDRTTYRSCMEGRGYALLPDERR